MFKFLFALTSFILVFASIPFANNVSASTMQTVNNISLKKMFIANLISKQY